jgi:hypothetical protein
MVVSGGVAPAMTGRAGSVQASEDNEKWQSFMKLAEN